MLLIAAAAVLLPQLSHALDNGLARTPPMGWSTWNLLGCQINETLVLDAARGIKDSGLLDLGYEYINIDDCWQAQDRDAKTGAPVEDHERFPSGLKHLVHQLHDLGFKAGIYSSGGIMTCQRRFGSLDLEKIDAETYASWGFDALKYDNCYNEGRSGTAKLSFDRYNVMRNALNATGRPMLYQLCNWGEDGPWNWATTLSNTWRMSGDVTASFDLEDDRCGTCSPYEPCLHAGYKCSIMNIVEKAAGIVHKGYPGSFPDLDSLEVGVGSLTIDEEIAHMSLWALVKSPLMLGHDPKTLLVALQALPHGADVVHGSIKERLEILANKQVLAVNQDPLGRPGYRITKALGGDAALQLWKADLVDGDFALLVINAGTKEKTANVTFSEFFIDEGYSHAGLTWDAKDLWDVNGSQVALRSSFSARVPEHGARMFKLSRVSQMPIEKAGSFGARFKLQSP